MRFTVKHEIQCDPDTFWRVYFDEEYIHGLYLDALGATAVEIEAQDGTVAEGLTRRLCSVQPIDAPGPVRKALGDSTTNVEEGEFDPAAGRWSFRLTPSKMADKLKVSGTISVVDKGDGTVERICEMDVAAKIFGVGPIFEKFIEKQTRDAQDKAAAYTNQFLAR